MSDNQGITPPHLQGFGSPSTGGASMSEECPLCKGTGVWDKTEPIPVEEPQQ